MQSISEPLNLLHEDGSWFARAHELELWLLRCDANLRKPALTLVPKFEFHHDNRSAWPVLLDGHTRADDGWQLRANNLAVDWGRRVEAFAKEGVEQGPAWAQQGLSGLAGFATTVTLILRAMVAPLEGLVIVLAPGVIEDVAALQDELMALLSEPALERCRWVLLLDHQLPLPRALIDNLGPERCLITDCVVDDETQRRDITAMLGAGNPAHFGTAWPTGVQPPPRVDDPPPLAKEHRDAALQAAGVNPALIEGGPKIRAAVLGAAMAMKEGRGSEAIGLQRQAAELCAAMGLTELQVISQTSLAAYLSGLGQRPAAKQLLGETVNLARAQGLHRSESQTLLALGLLHNLDGDPEASAQAYVESARAAEAGGEPQLAIESWRMAGQLAAGIRQDQAAVDAFAQALRVAGACEPDEVRRSSAPEAARQLAAVYERHLMHDQAGSLYAMADAMEAEDAKAEAESSETGELASDAGE